jgi:hypothetical protein
MVMWVVKIYDYETDNTDVYGVYSNLALAGRAVIKSIQNYWGGPTTFVRFEEPWGYKFQIKEIDNGLYDCQEIEIGRVTVNE